MIGKIRKKVSNSAVVSAPVLDLRQPMANFVGMNLEKLWKIRS